MTAPALPRPGTKNGNGKDAAPMPGRPFVAGSRVSDVTTYDETRTLVAGTQDLRSYEIPPNGYLSNLYIEVVCTTAGNAAAVTFAADGPFNVLDTVIVSDVNSKPIVGPLTGWDLRTLQKYGGYSYQDDPRLSPVYSATTGGGATGGSFAFIVKLPLQIRKRDAAGSLPNKSSSATFDVALRLSGSATPYGVAPTNPGSVRVRITTAGWMDPNATDLKGNPVNQDPPGVQSTQYWSKQTYPLAAAAFYQKLQGLDSYIRNFLFELRDNSNVRTSADWPDPLTMQYEVVTPLIRTRNLWHHLIGQDYGYTAALDAAGGRDSGQYPLTYADDFAMKPGNETGLQWLPVAAATNVTLSGTIGGANLHNLVILVNKVIPVNGDPRALTGV